jgi:hypothetical protein
MDKRIFKFKELDREEGTPGRHLAFTDVTFSPLSYSELRDAKLSQSMTIPLHGRGATIVSSDVDGVSVNQVGDIRTSLETPFTSRSVGLVKGGWLPSAFRWSLTASGLIPKVVSCTQVIAAVRRGARAVAAGAVGRGETNNGPV